MRALGEEAQLEARLGAWASAQSQIIAGRETLTAALAEVTARFDGKPVDRPPHWGGFCLVPERVEFWQGKPDRLHERVSFTRTETGWTRSVLSP